MPQFTTPNFMQDVAPGAVFSNELNRRTESTVAPPIIASQTLTVGGLTPTIAGDYVIRYTRPSGDVITLSITAGSVGSLAGLADILAPAIAARTSDWRVSHAAAVITLRARNPIQANNITVVSVPGGTTLTASAGVAPSSYEFALGLFYAQETAVGALDQGAFLGDSPITPTPIRQLTAGDNLAAVRGVHAATDNQDQMRGNEDPRGDLRFLRSGQIGYGLRRGECGVVVTGATTITLGSTVYAVLAPTGGNVIQSALTAEADGGNTLALATRVRLVTGERTLRIGNHAIRCARVEMI